ncbi:MAG: glycosyltransferase [Lachnospiraceae bacterium]|nr:glycosyltransferase [Lachnospiraceae bacterium]
MADIDNNRDDVVFPKRTLGERINNYYRRYGLGRTILKMGTKILHINVNDNRYDKYVKSHMISEEVLAKQRETVFAYTPLISVVIPMYHTPLAFLQELIEAFLNQTYSNWELCLADGSEDDSLRQYVLEYSHGDSRVVYGVIGSNEGISSNTNAAIAMATGEWIGFSDHDDLVTPDALYEIVKALNENPEIDSIYTDEDKIDMLGKKYFDPHFKPDFNIDLLCSNNYITHFFLTRKSVIDKAGLLNSKFDGSQDYDMIFRCAENSRCVHHVPRVLYHWRCHENSTAMNPESKMYCYEAGRGALKAHWDRLGIPAETEILPDYGYYRTRYKWPERPGVDIVIADVTDINDLEHTIASIDSKSTYDNYNFVIVSGKHKLEDIRGNIKTEHNMQVVEFELEHAAKDIESQSERSTRLVSMYNHGIKHCDSEYILLLDSQMQLDEASTIKEMLDVCMRPDVGCVGTRVYDTRGIMEHTGIILGNDKKLRYVFNGIDRRDPGYYHRATSTIDVTAVPMRGMMTKKSLWDSVGGFNLEYLTEFAQVDFGLRVEQSGKLNVYTPYGGFTNCGDKYCKTIEPDLSDNQFMEQYDKLTAQWQQMFDRYDKHYNPNFGDKDANYTIEF